MSSAYLFKAGYQSGQRAIAALLTSPVDLGLTRPSEKLDLDFQKRLLKYLASVNGALADFTDMLYDANSLSPDWSLPASFFLLDAVRWHVYRPFQEVLEMVQKDVIDQKRRVEYNKWMFRASVLNSDLIAEYDKAVNGVANLKIELLRYAKIASTSTGRVQVNGYLTIPQNEQVPNFHAPIATPLELLCEILRRTSRSAFPGQEEVDGKDILNMVNRSEYVLKLRSTNRGDPIEYPYYGRPRVMTWTVGKGGQPNDQAVIRTTKPAWESLRPLEAVTDSMRRNRIARHQEFFARMIATHRALIKKHEDASAPNVNKQVSSRKAALAEWDARYSARGYQLSDILAGSFSGQTFKFVSRCFSCRTLCQFKKFIDDDPADTAWMRRDQELPAIQIVKQQDGQYVGVVIDKTKCPHCGETHGAAANYDIYHPGAAVPIWPF